MLRSPFDSVEDFLRIEYEPMSEEEVKMGWEKAKSAVAGIAVGALLGFTYAVILFIY